MKTFLGLSEDFEDLIRPLWGISEKFWGTFEGLFDDIPKNFYRYSEFFLRMFQGLSVDFLHDFLKTFCGLTEEFLWTFLGLS